MRVVCLGDSLTWGGYGGNFVAAFQGLLPQHEIINSGSGGNTVINLLRRVNEELDPPPDGVFVMVGGNDAISNLYPATRPYYEQVQQIPGGRVTPQQFAPAYRELLTRILSQHVLAWVGLPPVEYSPALVETLQRYNRLAQESAGSLSIPVLDLMARFPADAVPERPPLDISTINLIGRRSGSGWSDYEAARREGGYSFTFDGLHLMPAAAEKMAHIIAGFLDLSGDRAWLQKTGPCSQALKL